MQRVLLFTCLISMFLARPAVAATDYTGFWKGSCDDAFGIQIKPHRDHLYSVSFCGPGGCFEPGTWTPDTKIDGDSKYKVFSSTEIGIKQKDGKGFFKYVRCTSDPTWAKGTIPKQSPVADGWPDFKAAVLSKDFKRIFPMLRPDVEVYKSGKTLSFGSKYNDFMASPDEELVSAFTAETGSVWEEISRTEPVEEIRLILDFGVGKVYKFPKGRILTEIVFFPHEGKYRVYEVVFKDK
jgi:hypothetical protein